MELAVPDVEINFNAILLSKAHLNLDLSYLGTVDGQKNLRRINDELKKEFLQLTLNEADSSVILTINLRIPTASGTIELAPIFTLNNEIKSNAGAKIHKITENDLNKLKLFARTIGNNQQITSPVIRNYSHNRSFHEKMCFVRNSIAEGVKKTIANEIGIYIGESLLVLFGIEKENRKEKIVENHKKKTIDALELVVQAKKVFKKYEQHRKGYTETQTSSEDQIDMASRKEKRNILSQEITQLISIFKAI